MISLHVLSFIYKHNFPPHNYLIWNKKNILYKHNFLFLENWVCNNILLVDQLFNEKGRPFTYEKFLAKYRIPVTPGDYAKVFGAIPTGIYMLCISQPRVTLQRRPVVYNLVTDSPIGKTCFSNIGRNNNRSIRTLF